MQRKVVYRKDFVGKYIGQTVLKTKALLRANLGKELFIEEPHTLCFNERDTFGKEALRTINLFMKENPGSINVVFGDKSSNTKQCIL